ncbi:MAG: hypothetical protein DME65_12460 [Verrucomicrobia bacterium]|nr:MAG: hypothetical protein DME65_12460 [Verrucomicrobiota bacterium]
MRVRFFDLQRVRTVAVEHRACALQGVAAGPWICRAILRTPDLQVRAHTRKALNQRDFLRRGTLFAAIEEKTFVSDNHDRGASMKSILDESFRYTKSIDTDLRKTFARIRREQREQARAQIEGENPRKVFPLRERKHVGAS